MRYVNFGEGTREVDSPGRLFASRLLLEAARDFGSDDPALAADAEAFLASPDARDLARWIGLPIADFVAELRRRREAGEGFIRPHRRRHVGAA